MSLTPNTKLDSIKCSDQIVTELNKILNRSLLVEEALECKVKEIFGGLEGLIALKEEQKSPPQGFIQEFLNKINQVNESLSNIEIYVDNLRKF